MWRGAYQGVLVMAGYYHSSAKDLVLIVMDCRSLGERTLDAARKIAERLARREHHRIQLFNNAGGIVYVT